MRRRKRLPWKLFVVLAVFIGLYAMFRTEIQPIIDEMAKMQMDGVISTLMNDAINEQIATGVIEYDRMVLLEKDVAGNLTALSTNMSEVNHLKTQILGLINSRLEHLQQQTVGLPLGSIVLPVLFSGQGPEIPIRLVSVGSSGADFENQFSEAGINQTLHRILLTTNVNVTILVPGGTVNKRVVTEVVVAETIVVGTVPQNYVTIEDNQDRTGDTP